MQILIGGDLVPTKSNLELFYKGDVSTLLGAELLSLWNAADLRIFNLEAPLTDRKDPIIKFGPNMAAPCKTIAGIKALRPSLITLANNHILDQGVHGLISTQMLLNKHQIPYIGAGDRISQASKPCILQYEGIKVGVYAYAEHEFSIASDTTPGANPFDPMESLDQIYRLKSECDYVIILYHGGKEHYRYPSPYLQKLCRKMILKGADLVLCQRSHCIGCFEKYHNATIVYGQGNFIFDASDSMYWKTSLFIKMVIDENGYSVDYIPIVQFNNVIRLAKDVEAEHIIKAFYLRSQKIKRKNFVQQRYTKLALSQNYSYLSSLSGYGRWLSGIDHRLLNGYLIKKMYASNKLLAIQNYMECETHRELMIEGIKKREIQFHELKK